MFHVLIIYRLYHFSNSTSQFQKINVLNLCRLKKKYLQKIHGYFGVGGEERGSFFYASSKKSPGSSFAHFSTTCLPIQLFLH